MNRLIILFVLSLWAGVTFAQDIIVKRDATKIEAVILEVSDSEIRYKSYSNQEGPTFVIKTDDIATIMYKNGEVQVFEKKSSKSGNQNNPSLTGEASYMDGKYFINDKVMYKDEFKTYMFKNCLPAFDYYRRISNMAYAGVGLMSSGAAILIAGIICIDNADDEITIALCAVGTSVLVAGIPLCAVGYVNRRKACYIYNEKCANTAYFNRNKGVRLDLQSSRDGIGLALKF